MTIAASNGVATHMDFIVLSCSRWRKATKQCNSNGPAIAPRALTSHIYKDLAIGTNLDTGAIVLRIVQPVRVS
jgi:hypothetical protein